MKNLTMQVTDAKRIFYKESAEKKNISLAFLMKEGTELLSKFDHSFLERIGTLAMAMNIPEYLVIQNLCLSWMARKEAHAEVFGLEGSTLKEFMFTENGPVTGEELFRILKENFVKNFEFEKENQLRLDSQYGAISKEDAEWLKQRNEKYKRAADAQKQAIENRAKGLWASFFEGEDEGKILADMKAKREKQKEKA